MLRFASTCALLLAAALFAVPASAIQAKPFEQWLLEFRKDAMAQGISSAVLDEAFEGIDEPAEDVLEHDVTQPEKTRTFGNYIENVLAESKVKAGLEKEQANRTALKKISKEYGVPVPVLLSLWGIESHFGKLQGDHNVVESLATLAYDGRRAEFFRKELINALKILQQEKIPSAELTGSWAGAMGQVQFMPTSFLSFAVDSDGDGKRDIWASNEDALASMANYLKSKGWKAGQGWGIRVDLPESVPLTLVKEKTRKSWGEWKKLGLTGYKRKELPRFDGTARLVTPDDNYAFAYLVFPNYEVIMDWNRSTFFATSVGLLADRLKAAR